MIAAFEEQGLPPSEQNCRKVKSCLLSHLILVDASLAAFWPSNQQSNWYFIETLKVLAIFVALCSSIETAIVIHATCIAAISGGQL